MNTIFRHLTPKFQYNHYFVHLLVSSGLLAQQQITFKTMRSLVRETLSTRSNYFYFCTVTVFSILLCFSVAPEEGQSCLAVIYDIKSYPFGPSFCFFVLYLPFYGIYNYILLFPVSLVIIIIIIIQDFYSAHARVQSAVQLCEQKKKIK